MNPEKNTIFDIILTVALVILFRLFAHLEINILIVFTDVLIIYLLRCAAYYFGKFCECVDEKWHEKDGKSTAYHELVVVGICGILLAVAIIFTYVFASIDNVPTEISTTINSVVKLAVFAYLVALASMALVCQLNKNAEHMEKEKDKKEEKKEGKENVR